MEDSNYRKKYEMYCGKMPKGFEIHHIDFNHNNNDIANLVALPKALHSKYHKVAKVAPSISFEPELKGMFAMGQGYNYFSFQMAEEFIEVWKECQKYVYERDKVLYKYGH